MKPHKTYFNWSTGKDSALALYHLLQDKHYTVDELITSVNSHYNRVSMHGLRKELLIAQTNALHIPASLIELPEMPSMEDAAREVEAARHYASFWLGLDTQTQEKLAKMLPQVTEAKPVVDLDQDDTRDATRACFAMADHPGLFSRLAGALALSGANVVEARSYTTNDGMAADVFWIQDDEGKPYDQARLPRLRRMIQRTLAGEVIARDEFAERDKLKRREKDFIVPTEVTFDNEGSEIYTIITVDTRDRPGLLHDLARTLTSAHMQISSTIIATYGEQAVDSFYVKDAFGLKAHSAAKQKQLRAALIDAVRRGAERAEQ